MVLRDKSVVRFGYNVSEILPQKVATGTAYACLRPIERASSSGARACSQKVLGLRMFPYAFLLREDNGFHQHTLSYNSKSAKKAAIS